MSSWADPVSAREQEGVREGNHDERNRMYRSRLGVDEEGGAEDSDISEARRNAWFGTSENRWKSKEKARFHSLLSVVDGEDFQAEKELGRDSGDEEEWGEEEGGQKRLSWFDPRR